MFTPHKYPNASVAPWEYYPAAAGTYKAGQLVELIDGQMAAFADANGVMPYLCMADITVEDGGIIPAIFCNADTIYATELAADAAGAKVGSMAAITDGLTATIDDAGTFEITALEGTTAGSVVYGRLRY